MLSLPPLGERLNICAANSLAGGRASCVRFRLQPEAAIALAARIKRPGKEFMGVQRELYLDADGSEAPSSEIAPYERLLGDAMVGDGALFAGEDAVMAAWARGRAGAGRAQRSAAL